MRQMVPSTNNTSQSFPMYNELNLDGVVYFYANVYTPLFKRITSHLQPVESAIIRLTHLNVIDGPLESVLKKTY